MAENTPGRSYYCSSSSAAMAEYDVFLNHRGPDVKGGFVAHLHEALRSVGLNPFLDKISLVKGDHAFESIDEALEVARVHVAVVSKGYAESKYCLSELVTMMRSGKPVVPVFYDVEAAHLRRVENGPFAAAFEKHKLRESVEQVEEWADALGKLANITGFCFRLTDHKGDEAELKREVVDAISNLMPIHEDLQVDPQLVGVEAHLDTCIGKLEQMSTATSLLCLVGMGGVGKSTLAKEIYNRFARQKKFQSMSFLEIDRNVSQDTLVGSSLLNRLQKQVLWDLLHVPDNSMQRYSYWFHKLSRQGPVLIVLDDIHDKVQYDNLIPNTSFLAAGSCIIITSRDRHLLNLIVTKKLHYYIHEVTPLRCDDSQRLFNLYAFQSEEAPEDFKVLAKDVSEACGGLPLALKVVGSSLSDKRSNEDLECIWPEAIDALQEDPNIMNALKWSYNCLLEPEKMIFVDIACMFYGWEKQEALEIWKSCKECLSCCGYKTPHMSLRQLIDKSLVQIEKLKGAETLVIHGLLQAMGQGIGKFNGSHLWNNRGIRILEDENQDASKVKALNLVHSGKQKFEAKNFAKFTNLHYLILDGCDVHGNFSSIFKELRWLRWRYMPMIQLPSMPNLSNLISLDFSESTILANILTKSNTTFEACPNLLRLDLSACTSIGTLPDSIGCLSKLQVLDLDHCNNLQQLPSSIGELTSLHELSIGWCTSLKALPDTITSLSNLQQLYLGECSSISELPISIGLMKNLQHVDMDLTTEWQARAIGQLKALERLGFWQCTDEAIAMLDSLEALKNLDQLSLFWFIGCTTMTKLPKTMGLLTNLNELELYGCDEVQELPNSIGQLKVLTTLWLSKCNTLHTIPDSLGALNSLQKLYIVQCPSIIQLPISIGNLSNLCELVIEGCDGLESLPNSIKHLNALVYLELMECGSLEDLGALSVLQGAHMWGCTSITKLPGSCIIMMDINYYDPSDYCDHFVEGYYGIHRNLKEMQMVEINDCGFLRIVHDDIRPILQRIYKSPCKVLAME